MDFGEFERLVLRMLFETNLPLTAHPNVVRWLDRVRAQPGFLPQVYPYAVDPHSSAELP